MIDIDPGAEAPLRVVDARFGPWMMREPDGAAQEAMAPGHAARAAARERLVAEVPDPGERLKLPVKPLLVNEVVYLQGHTREVLPLLGVAAEYGPVRPVVPPERWDVERLTGLIREVGTRTRCGVLETIFAALYAVEQRIGAEPPPELPESGPVPAGALVRADPLTAGRPGSWEASDLVDFIWVIGPTMVGDKMVHEELHQAAVEIFHRWATGPAGYVEFAETIPSILAPVIEEDGLTAIGGFRTIGVERVRMWASSKSQMVGGL